ncbi:2-deoxy-D-gluconate 3-dehydrogenase [Perkinsela sp. CCAP 1560/4]|nr:2-deoxy-D-gluconate 3-dehydrogenase [Perkinsela sp. CCAP 1560/4]KNH08299.1 2-deoxy-D-gluconate 3-dehydrogenase [Perkinsela sp. CCAP 1560/4]|eukprot:KNH03679.1 2-deoxy-D-gluconate 3-dehydrogenase [Perkinsela sp. CCAP 1560/4]
MRESTTSNKQRLGKYPLPQVLNTRNYDKLRVLVLNYCKEKSETTRFRALSTLNGTVMKVEDPGEIKLLMEVYKLLDSESMVPESVKQKAVTEEEQDAMKYIETSILSISTLRDRFDKDRLQKNNRTLKEIRKHTEDPVYELAQFITTISDVAYATFLIRFTDVADCTCLDNRALSVLLGEVKKRTSKPGSPDHLWMRTIRVLMLSRDFDRSFLSSGSEKIIRSLHLFDFMSCIRTAEYALSCTGFEDFNLFLALLDRLNDTIGDAPTGSIHRVYHAINMIGLYHFPLIKQLNQRYRLAFNAFSLEANITVLDCILSMPETYGSNILRVKASHFNKEIIKDEPLITRLMDMILQSYDTLPWNDHMKLRQARRLCWCLQQPEIMKLDSRKDLIHRVAQNMLMWLTFNGSNLLITQSLLEQIDSIVWKNRDLHA